jgi:hypothetical protein
MWTRRDLKYQDECRKSWLREVGSYDYAEAKQGANLTEQELCHVNSNFEAAAS